MDNCGCNIVKWLNKLIHTIHEWKKKPLSGTICVGLHIRAAMMSTP